MDPSLTDIISYVLGIVADWMQDHMDAIVLSMVATLLVIYGDNLLTFVKQQIGSLKLFLRISLFVAFCAFGFAFLTSVLSPFISSQLGKIDDIWLPFVVIGSYYLLGIAAQKKGML